MKATELGPVRTIYFRTIHKNHFPKMIMPILSLSDIAPAPWPYLSLRQCTLEVTLLKSQAYLQKVTEKDLHDFFAYCGVIEHVEIIRCGEYACMAYVTFKDAYSFGNCYFTQWTAVVTAASYTGRTAVAAANAVVNSRYFAKGALWISDMLNHAAQAAADLGDHGNKRTSS